MAKKLGELLIETSVLTEKQLQEALSLQKKSGKALGDALIALKFVSKETIAYALKAQSNSEKVNLDDYEITPDLVSLVPREFAEMSMIFPLAFDGTKLTVAMANPSQIHVLDSLRFMLNVSVKALEAEQDAIEFAIN